MLSNNRLTLLSSVKHCPDGQVCAEFGLEDEKLRVNTAGPGQLRGAFSHCWSSFMLGRREEETRKLGYLYMVGRSDCDA